MPFKRVLWLALLLPQHALLICVAFSQMRLLRRDLSPEPTYVLCGNSIFHFDPPVFGWTVLGLLGILGLCGRRAWGGWLYGVFALVLFSVSLAELQRSGFSEKRLLAVNAVIVTTLAGWIASRPKSPMASTTDCSRSVGS